MTMGRQVLIADSPKPKDTGAASQQRWLLLERFENEVCALREWWGEGDRIATFVKGTKTTIWAIEVDKAATQRASSTWTDLARRLEDSGEAIDARESHTEKNTDEAERYAAACTEIEAILQRKGSVPDAVREAQWWRWKHGHCDQVGLREEGRHTLMCTLGRNAIGCSIDGRWIVEEGEEPAAQTCWKASHAATNPLERAQLEETLKAMCNQIMEQWGTEADNDRIAMTQRTLKEWGLSMELENGGWFLWKEPAARANAHGRPGAEMAPRQRRVSTGTIICMIAIATLGLLMVEQSRKETNPSWQSAEYDGWIVSAPPDKRWECKQHLETVSRRIVETIASKTPMETNEAIKVNNEAKHYLVKTGEGVRGWADPTTGWMQIEGRGSRTLRFQLDTTGFGCDSAGSGQ